MTPLQWSHTAARRGDRESSTGYNGRVPGAVRAYYGTVLPPAPQAQPHTNARGRAARRSRARSVNQWPRKHLHHTTPGTTHATTRTTLIPTWALGEQFVPSVPKPRWVKTLGWPELEGWGCAARRRLTQQGPLLLLAYTRRLAEAAPSRAEAVGPSPHRRSHYSTHHTCTRYNS